MTMKAILSATRLEAAFESEQAAERVFFQALEAVGSALQADDRRAMAEVLPSPIDEALLGIHERGDVDLDGVVEEVAAACQVPRGRALEVVEAVGAALAERLPETLRARLERHGGPSLGSLWARRKLGSPPERRRAPSSPPGSGHTLASGRPGSRHPLSEAGPIGHVDSVAANPDPHGDTKLSGARGTTAEREHRTLAEGRPGSRHPLSEAGED